MSDPVSDTAGDLVFGRFRLSPRLRALTEADIRVTLGSRAFDVLWALTRRRGALVSKDVLLAEVWPGVFVEEGNLTVQISGLRKLLGDGQGATRFIETVPGRGYRFVHPIDDDVQHVMSEPRAASPQMRPAIVPPVSRFIGRRVELAELQRLLGAHRLVTITGPGGVGKTRLALEFAAASTFAESAMRVDLGDIRDGAFIGREIAAAIGLDAREDRALEAVADWLRVRRALVILDNCEHLAAAAAKVVDTLLRRSGGLFVLATSRQPLGLPGEMRLALDPLPLPEASSGQAALEVESVALFVDRATAQQPGFRTDDATLRQIGELCRQLDGIPLAIELAVPRLRILGLSQILARLDDRFRLLGEQRFAGTGRQHTLQAVMDWSYDLLDETERLVLDHVAGFSGGCELEALGIVVADMDEMTLIDALSGLSDKSLLVVDIAASGQRYRLLETTRAYILARMGHLRLLTLQRAHASHMAAFFARGQAAWPTEPSHSWIATYGPEAANLEQALAWAFGPNGDLELGLRLVAASGPLWWERPQIDLRRRAYWFDRAEQLIATNTPPAIAGWLQVGKSWRDMQLGDRDNLAPAERAIALFRQTQDRTGLGAALWRAGSALINADTLEQADLHLAEAQSVLEAGEPCKFLAFVLIRRGDLRMRQDRLEEARGHYARALDLTNWLGDWYGLVNGGSNMAELLFRLGEHEAALEHLLRLRDALPRGRRAPLVSTLVAHLLCAGRVREAELAAEEALLTGRFTGFGATVAWTVEAMALAAAQAADLMAAARLAGYAARHLPSAATRMGARREVHDRLDAALAGLPAERRATLAGLGAATPEERIVTEALAFCHTEI